MASRSKHNCWLVLLEPDAWQILPPQDSKPPTAKATFRPEALAEQAAAIHEALIAAGWRNGPLVLGISAETCVAATVDVPAPAMLRKRQAMRYHLEGWIPWSAEDFVADYVAHKSAALMVAARTAPFEPLLKELDERDASPVVVAPMALLALGSQLAAEGVPDDHVLVWKHDDTVELFVVRDGRPLIWRSSAATSAADVVELCASTALGETASVPWLARGLSPQALDLLSAFGMSVAYLPELDWDEALRQASGHIAAGEAEPLVNLRRDELAGERPLRAMARQLSLLKACAALAIGAACAALWIRGDRYAQSAAVVRAKLAEVYEATFPTEPVPDRIGVAMRRAHQVLQGTRGPVKELAVGPTGDSVLEKVLGALPADLRYRVPEIRIEGASVFLSGEVRSNADADRIVATLRAAGFEVDPPRTQRLAEQGFSVRVAALCSSSDKGAVTK